ncbi:MAG: helix-turn-helix domain-containing protein [Bacteroidales bacterium]|nr:helix-turn-helix domain-containing protein [Bacteroidales bacterium]
MNEEFAINSRVMEVMNLKRLSPSQFADMMKVNRASISQLASNRNKPSIGFLMNLLHTFPDIDANWLLLGTVRIVPESRREFEKDFSIEKREMPMVEKEELPDESVVVSEKTTPVRKEIEKIVVFYTDKTFSESYPE